jgi:hypothetical protein
MMILHPSVEIGFQTLAESLWMFGRLGLGLARALAADRLRFS